MYKNQAGFTLIELLIVVAIIAILAAIAIPNFLAAQVRAKVSRVKGELRTISIAYESFYVDNNMYPLDSEANPGDYQVRFHEELTTPVAYLTSVSFKDPFSGNATWNGFPLNYKAFNYKQVPDSNSTTFNWANFVANASPPEIDHNAYGIESYGPDLNYSAIEWYDYRPDDDANQIFRVYDPTNGTVSNGDIIRLGGDSFHSANP